MDISHNETGEAIEGAFYSIWLFGQKVANASSTMILFLILGQNGWLETNQGKILQPAEELEALKFSITLVPSLVFFW